MFGVLHCGQRMIESVIEECGAFVAEAFDADDDLVVLIGDDVAAVLVERSDRYDPWKILDFPPIELRHGSPFLRL